MLKHKYIVYLNGAKLGEVMAISTAQAINCVRYRKNLLYKPMSSFKARLVA